MAYIILPEENVSHDDTAPRRIAEFCGESGKQSGHVFGDRGGAYNPPTAGETPLGLPRKLYVFKKGQTPRPR